MERTLALFNNPPPGLWKRAADQRQADDLRLVNETGAERWGAQDAMRRSELSESDRDMASQGIQQPTALSSPGPGWRPFSYNGRTVWVDTKGFDSAELRDGGWFWNPTPAVSVLADGVPCDV